MPAVFSNQVCDYSEAFMLQLPVIQTHLFSFKIGAIKYSKTMHQKKPTPNKETLIVMRFHRSIVNNFVKIMLQN